MQEDGTPFPAEPSGESLLRLQDPLGFPDFQFLERGLYELLQSSEVDGFPLQQGEDGLQLHIQVGCPDRSDLFDIPLLKDVLFEKGELVPVGQLPDCDCLLCGESIEKRFLHAVFTEMVLKTVHRAGQQVIPFLDVVLLKQEIQFIQDKNEVLLRLGD